MTACIFMSIGYPAVNLLVRYSVRELTDTIHYTHMHVWFGGMISEHTYADAK